MHHDGVDAGQRPSQPGDVLVVVKRVAAGPVHALDVGVGEPQPVVVERLAGVQQHIADRRDRDERLHRVEALRQRRQPAAQRRQPRLVHRPVAVPETASGKPDLAEHGRQRQTHPRCLLAVADPLQRPADGDDGAPGGHPAGQRGQVVGGQPADRRRPLRRLRHPVVSAQQVALEPVVAGAVGAQKRAVGQRFGGQHISQREHDRHVGARNQGMPFAIAVDVVAQWRKRHDAPAPVTESAQRVTRRMCRGAAVIDPGVLEGQTAEAHQQVGVFDDDLPVGGPFEQVIVGSHHPRHDHPGRAQAVGVPRKCISAKEFQEAMHLALGMVEPPGAGPAVRAAVDRLVAVGVDHAAQLAGQQLGELVPGDGHELVGAARRARPGPVAQPTAAHGRGGDPRPMTDRPGQVAQQRRRIGVAVKRCHGRDVTGIDFGRERTPMREAGGGVRHDGESRADRRRHCRPPTIRLGGISSP